MERGKGEAAIDEEGKLLGVKLRRGITVRKRGGPCTPVPAWKLEEDQPGPSDLEGGAGRRSSAAAVSARKLGANLWEIQDLLPGPRMSRRAAAAAAAAAGPSRRGEQEGADRPLSAGSLRRHAAASLIQHHKLNEKRSHVLHPVSPAAYSSSVEVASLSHADTPSSSADLNERFREGGYSLKTSAELLKVLNRIWSLEEKNASNVSLVKALKVELQHAQARIQELMHEQQTNHHEMDDMMKQVAEEKLIRKSKEQDRIKKAVQSMRDELEDERRLRRRSESLHRRLGKDLSEVKAAFAKVAKELERERKENCLLEDLCDEFAKGIGSYELEVRELKQKSAADCDHIADRLVLHMSEAWLDERLQMKVAEGQGDLAEKSTIIERLSGEIMTFLQARRSDSSKNDINYQKNLTLRRQSLESVHLNGATSAPRDADDDSTVSDLHCFELNFVANENEIHDQLDAMTEIGFEKLDSRRMSNSRRKKLGYYERIKGNNSSISQVQIEEKMDNTKSSNGNMMHAVDRLHGTHSHSGGETGGTEADRPEIIMTQKAKKCDSEESGQVMIDVTHISNLQRDNLVKKHSEFSKGCKIHAGNCHGEESCSQFPSRGHFVSNVVDNCSGDVCTLSRPVQQWSYHSTLPDIEISESTSKVPQGIKENTLKAKLLEARLEGQHARLKASKGSSSSGIPH